MAKKKKTETKATASPTKQSTNTPAGSFTTVLWLAFVLAVTAVVFSPMLGNELTNWDDLFYVTQNNLLRGPDWKGIFSQPVVSNYHPLTVASLAFNYQTSQLAPFSYLLTNYLLHLINTFLVFAFIFRISDGKTPVAVFTALVFGIHPMHVESVAWVSERKDVLYTLFFMLSLLCYWQYLLKNKVIQYWLCALFFVLSLLSKPAAIVLPFVLLLLDFYKGKTFSMKALVQKIPLFVLSLIFAIVTLKIQSLKAVSSLEMISAGVRPLFATYSVMTYFVRFFAPTPLSAFHPYPPMDSLGWPVYISPLIILSLCAISWLLRRNKALVFGMLFFIVNLLLVLQIVSFGNTIVSERYTYVPYIGMAFALAMLIYHYASSAARTIVFVVSALVILGFGSLSYQRTKVWKDSGSLWTDVISHYPYSAVPRSNRANYYTNLAREPQHAAEAEAWYQQSLTDCEMAVKIDPKHAAGYRILGVIHLMKQNFKEAASDAEFLKRLLPDDPVGYTIGGSANLNLKNTEPALADLNKGLSMTPDDTEMLNNRGTLYFNLLRKYPEALADFNKALSLRQDGNYFLNRSRCYYILGDLPKAQADVRAAEKLRAVVGEDYKKLVGL